MPEVLLKKSSKPDKKYDAVIDGKKTVSFGVTGYSDFTKHKDEERKQRYIARHGATQTWKDIEKPQTWARYILWEKRQYLRQLRIWKRSLT